MITHLTIYQLIQEKQYDELLLLNDSDAGDMAYAMIQKGPYEQQHFCCYLNVDKSEWLPVSDFVRDDFRVTFASVGSVRLSIKKLVQQSLPVKVRDFWIGIDFYQQNDVTREQALEHLMNLYRGFNEMVIMSQRLIAGV